MVPQNALSMLSMLPLAQRLVSIEVQDDYAQLAYPSSKRNGAGSRKSRNNSITGQISMAWENFIDLTWNLFFESRHRKQKLEQQQQMDRVQMEVQRRWDAKQQRRQQRQQHRFVARDVKETIQQHDNLGEDEDLIELGEKRVQYLEQYIRPALLPTKSWADLNRPLFTHHSRIQHANYHSFVRWIRGEYLIAKYGLFVQRAVRQFPELRDDAAGLSSEGVVVGTNLEGEEVELPLERILPSVNTVREAFGMQDWSRRKVPFASWVEDKNSDDNNNGESNISDLSIEQIVHQHLEGQIAHSGPLNAFFEMRRREDSYELWTREYIFGLSQYLLERIEEMDRQYYSARKAITAKSQAFPFDTIAEQIPSIETIILDVGAGDGRLVYFLRRAMEEIVSSKNNHSTPSPVVNIQRKHDNRKNHVPKSPISAASSISTLTKSQHTSNLPTLIATDDGSWRAPTYNNKHIQVEKLSVADALAKYGPKSSMPNSEQNKEETFTRLIVLCSWMPPGQDWTAGFRQSTKSVDTDMVQGSKRGEGGEGFVEEYILIGECDDGSCGHNWYTWGNPIFSPFNQHCDERRSERIPLMAPYVEDGYIRFDLEDLSLFQFSRFDCKRSSESKTVSFRRRPTSQIKNSVFDAAHR